jgi:hypothetical protein
VFVCVEGLSRVPRQQTARLNSRIANKARTCHEDLFAVAVCDPHVTLSVIVAALSTCWRASCNASFTSNAPVLAARRGLAPLGAADACAPAAVCVSANVSDRSTFAAHAGQIRYASVSYVVEQVVQVFRDVMGDARGWGALSFEPWPTCLPPARC